MSKRCMKSMSLIMVLVLVTISITGCGSNETKSSSNNEVVKLKFGSNLKSTEAANGNPAAVAVEEFVKEVERESNGTIDIQLFLDSQLASTNEEIISGIKSGAFDITNLSTGSWGEFTDAFMPLNIPYLLLNDDVVNKAIDGYFGQSMRDKVLKDTGIKNLSFLNIGFRHLTNSKRPIKSVEDIKGLKIRTQTDPYQIKAMEALGAAVTPISYSELFTSLQQGLVDGQENPLANIFTAKLYEVQKYLTMTGHNYTLTTININQNVFDGLSKEHQEIILKAARNAELKARELLTANELKIKEDLAQHLDIYDLSIEELRDFQAKTQEVWKDVEKVIGSEYYNKIIEEIGTIEKELGLN